MADKQTDIPQKEVPFEEKPLPQEEEEEEELLPQNEDGGAHVDFDFLDTEGRWLLKVLSGPNTGAEFAMHGGSSYLIGTDTQQCDVIFQDLSVSRKHARLTIDLNDNASLEDMTSKNGTFVDGEKIKKHTVHGNALVAMGTTTFMLIDREAEQTTIVAPSQFERKEETQNIEPIREAILQPIQEEIEKVKAQETQKKQEKSSQAISSLIILAIITGLILTIGIGVTLLFRTEEISTPEVVNPEDEIIAALSPFPEVRFSYNPANSRLMLVGHVLTSTDRSRLLDTTQQLKFIRVIDYSNVVIDEHVWREINQILSKNPAWRGITMTSPKAGHYILSGFLKSRKEAESLYDYISQNFEYVNLLERHVVVEEELIGNITRELTDAGFRGVTPTLIGGNLALNGVIPRGTNDKFEKIIALFKALPGIRSVQNLTSAGGAKEAVIDLTRKYQISGYSTHGESACIVINGRILESGDSLDSMVITEISPSTIFLEKNDLRYKIDFNQ